MLFREYNRALPPYNRALLLGTAVIQTREGVVVGFQIFVWAPKKGGDFLGFFEGLGEMFEGYSADM